jgi:hypothetical protein
VGEFTGPIASDWRDGVAELGSGSCLDAQADETGRLTSRVQLTGPAQYG